MIYIPEILPGKIIVKFYIKIEKSHPEAITNYEGRIYNQGDMVRVVKPCFPPQYANFICDKKLTISLPETVDYRYPQIEKEADKIAQSFMSYLLNKHPGAWKIFVGQLVDCSREAITLVYGIETEEGVNDAES